MASSIQDDATALIAGCGIPTEDRVVQKELLRDIRYPSAQIHFILDRQAWRFLSANVGGVDTADRGIAQLRLPCFQLATSTLRSPSLEEQSTVTISGVSNEPLLWDLAMYALCASLVMVFYWFILARSGRRGAR